MAAKNDGEQKTISEHEDPQIKVDGQIIWALHLLGRGSIAALYLNCLMGFGLILKSTVLFFFCEWKEISQNFPYGGAAAQEGVPLKTDEIKEVHAVGSETENGKSLHQATSELAHHTPQTDNKAPENGVSVKDPLHTALSGIEFLFLAPLSYLVLRSLAEYVRDLVDRAREKIAIGKNVEQRARAEASRLSKLLDSGDEEGEKSEQALDSKSEKEEPIEYLTLGKECILETKALMVALLFAIVGTHIIGVLIEVHHGKEPSITFGIVALSLLVILAGIYFGIELLIARLKSLDLRARKTS